MPTTRTRFFALLGAMTLAFMVFAQIAHADVRVVIGFKGAPNKTLLQAENAQIHGEVTDLMFIAATVPAAAIARLRADPRVAYVEQDTLCFASKGKPVKEDPPTAAPAQVVPWGVGRVWWGQMEVVDGAFSPAGSNLAELGAVTVVKVAIIDTGIDLNHPDLNVDAGGSVNFVSSRKRPDDDNGHGTHVAGISGALDNSIGVVGVAPGVLLYAVKVLDRRGSGYMSDVATGITWAAANGMHVANMSLGGSQAGTALTTSIANAAPDVLLVAASGNYGNEIIDNRSAEKSYPAADTRVLAVGSTNRADNVSLFSNTGSQVDLAAPGLQILSTYRGEAYATLSGTSMASPHVAGLAALLISQGHSYTGIESHEIKDTGLWARMKSLADDGALRTSETGANEAWAFGAGIASSTTE